uniref:AB hydrolase-1 domain-containing protein n=1 Tax=Triticum urartu TaxID=4572 RepID=A0A8R7V4G5_TRIUA
MRNTIPNRTSLVRPPSQRLYPCAPPTRAHLIVRSVPSRAFTSMIRACLSELCASCCSCVLPPPSSPRAADQEMDSDGAITHRSVETNGVRLHVAEAGPAGAPVALLLHGFPEVWYTWRHQMRALAAAGYRAVAPDMRGYGGSDAPPGGPDQYTALHVVGDLVALIDSLGEKQVFVVAHDWGAMIAWSLCLFRPDRVKALVALSVPFSPRSPARKPVDGLKALYGDEYYICRIQVCIDAM